MPPDAAVRDRLELLRQEARKVSTELENETGEEAICQRCGETIVAVIDPHSLCFDWGSVGKYKVTDADGKERWERYLDFGCNDENDPDGWGCDKHADSDGIATCYWDCDDRYLLAGSHDPGDDHTPCGYQLPHVCGSEHETYGLMSNPGFALSRALKVCNDLTVVNQQKLIRALLPDWHASVRERFVQSLKD